MQPFEYKFSIAQCDVPIERRPALEAYRAKRKQWIDWLDDDEHHAIWQTITSMVWTDVSFRALTHFAVEDENTSLANSLVAEQLISGHVARQVLAIRRLVDNTRGVISLRRLLGEVRSNYALFTRENFVCNDGLPYDYAAVAHKELRSSTGQGSWRSTTGPDAWSTSEMAHQKFDKLSGMPPERRARQDRLPTSVLNTIESWLDSSGADELADWSHNFLAHAGSAERRAHIVDARVTNNKISDVVKSLARVTEAISANVLYAGGRLNALMATAQYDQFEKLEIPIMSAEQKERAFELWHELSDERDSYLDGVDEDLIGAALPSISTVHEGQGD